MGRLDSTRGTLIAVEGVDGIGKSTATAALARRLRDAGLDVRVHDFPVYDEPRFGPLIAELLRGDLRIAGATAPQAVALLFAGNRAATAADLRAELAGGATLLCDRYHLSNAAYQGANVPPQQLDAFLDWLIDVELRVFGAIRPGRSLWLDVPLDLRPDTAAEDVFEADDALQARVRGVYRRLADRGEVTRVDGTHDGALLSPDDVAARLESVLEG